MTKSIKPILLALINIGATASVLYALNLVDLIVHGQLYEFDLRFDLAWANPYWNILRIIQVLLGVIAVSNAVNIVLAIRSPASPKKPTEKVVLPPRPAVTAPAATRTSERALSKPALETQTMPAPSPLSVAPHAAPSLAPSATSSSPLAPSAPTTMHSDIPELIRCSHCGKAFTQPLRMLDFQGDRPRVISICPFCNEIIPISQAQDEKEGEKKLFLRKKNGNHSPKTLASQTTS